MQWHVEEIAQCIYHRKEETADSQPVAKQFAALLQKRTAEGYRLHSWNLATSNSPDVYEEVIVAVFTMP